MSYVALATDAFEDVVSFYGIELGFPVVDDWDRPNGRGRRFDLGGLRLEIIDNAREKRPLDLGVVSDKFHIVVEVADIDSTWRQIEKTSDPPKNTSWGARVFDLCDPDGVSITFLQWTDGRRVSN